MPKFILTYYPWITQHVDSAIVRNQIQIFATALQEKSNIEIELASVMEVSQQIESIEKGNSHIALMNPLGFIIAHRQNPNVRASVVALRSIDGQIGDSYFAQIYTHIDSGITNLLEARNTSIGYGTPISTSNFIVPAIDLREANLHPFIGFKKSEFFGGHDSVAEAVYNKVISLGAGHDGVILDLAKKPGFQDAVQKLVRIHRSSPIPSDPIAVNIPDADARDYIQNCLVEISQEERVQEAIAIFWGNALGLRATTSEPYEYLYQAIQELGLTVNDLYS